jgi:hypothetical protein
MTVYPNRIPMIGRAMQAEAATLQVEFAKAEAEGDALTVETAELTAQVKAAKAEAREAQDRAEELGQADAARRRRGRLARCGQPGGASEVVRAAGGNRACPRRSGPSSSAHNPCHGYEANRAKANAIGAVENHGFVEPFPPTLKFPPTCVTPTLWLIACTMAACMLAVLSLLASR